MKRYSFEEVMQLDQSLQFLAMYEVTGGRLVIPKSMDEAMKWQCKIAEKFNEFKRLIQTGECSFEYIKWTVLGKNGAFPQNKISCDPSSPEFLEQALEWDREEKERMSEKKIGEEQVKSLVSKLVGSLFPDADSIKVNINMMKFPTQETPLDSAKVSPRVEKQIPNIPQPVTPKKKRSSKKKK